MIEDVLFVVVLVAFGVALYARHRSLQDLRSRPGYIYPPHDGRYRDDEGREWVYDWKTDEDRRA